MSESLFSFSDLSREQLETLLAAHRAEYLASFCEYINSDREDDREDADAALLDFERGVLNGN